MRGRRERYGALNWTGDTHVWQVATKMATEHFSLLPRSNGSRLKKKKPAEMFLIMLITT